MAEITSFEVVSAGYFTFGQVFKKGDVPSGQYLQVKTLAGTSVSAQVDRKTTWSDGSLCHAIITGDWPSPQNLYIHTTTTPESNTATSVGVLTALPFEVSIEVSVSAGSRYVATFAASASSGTIWLSGSQVTEWQNTSVAFMDAGASVNPHLKAFFYIRSYGDLSNRSVDIVVENGRFEGPNITPTYSVSVNVNGTNVYTYPSITHYMRSRWRKKIYQGSGHGLVKLNKLYWDSTRIHPPYDPTLTISQQSLTSYLNSMTNASDPMEAGITANNMPDAGAADGIGLLPRWTARYLITYDEQARQAMLLGDQAAGAFPTHFRDASTSYPADIDTRPNDGVAADISIWGTFWTLGMTVNDCPLVADNAHQPSFGYMSYLITGDYFYLEEVQFWASFCLISGNPGDGYRNGSVGYMKWDQVRAQAWSIRNIAFAAFVSPTGYMKTYFTNKLANNTTLYNARHSPGGLYYNQIGINNNIYAGDAGYYNFEGFAPWQENFVNQAVGLIKHLEFDVSIWYDAVSKLPVGLLGDDVYWNQAGSYVLRYKTANSPLFTNFRDIYLNSDLQPLQPNQMFGSGVDSYQAILRGSVAMAQTHSVPGAVSAWDRFQTRINQPNQAQWGETPNFALVPVSVATSLIDLPSVPVTGTVFCTTSITVGVVATASVQWTDVSGSTVDPPGTILWQSNPPGRVAINPNGLNATITGLNPGNNIEISAILGYQVSLPSGILPTLTSLGGPTALSISVSESLLANPVPTSLDQNYSVISKFYINVSATAADPLPQGNIFQVADSMAAGTWQAVPLVNSAVEAQASMGSFAPNNGADFGQMFNSWNGGALVVTGDATIDGYYMAACGGHNDYGGNEVYWLSFADMTVYRLTDADTYDDITCYPNSNCIIDAGARPNSRHTYGGVVYVPSLGTKGSILLVGGFSYGIAGGPNGDFRLDLEKVHSADPLVKAACWTPITLKPHQAVGLNAFVDPSGNVVYASAIGRIVAFNPNTDTVLSTGGQNFTSHPYGGGWDPINKIFIKFCDSESGLGKVHSWQLGSLNIGDNWAAIGNPSGPATYDSNGNRYMPPAYSRAQAVYHSGLNKFVICNMTKTVYFLDCKTNPSQWTYTSHDPSTGPAPLSQSGGVFTRWDKLPAPHSNVFIYWRATYDKEVWLYKLP